MASWRARVLGPLAAAVVAAAFYAPSGAGGTFFVGVDEDAPKWGRAQLTTSIAGALGLKAIRITVPWRPGQSRLPPSYQQLLHRTVVGSWGLRVVVSVYGRADDAPRTEDARSDYCDYVADLLRQNPTVNDVVVWNDPNDGFFWSPQFHPDGSSAAPWDYQALLGRCWDTLHAVRPTVNVVALSVSRGADQRFGTASSHSTVTWYWKLGAAYRASSRRLPLFDTVGHIPHPDLSAERPWTRHARSGSLGQGDYDRLLSALADAFRGTAQPLPGQGSVSIWYLAQGFQTAIDPAKARLYSGTETDPSPVPAWSLAAASDAGEGPAPDQATQLADAVRVAYCQPHVSAFFNFLLADEPDLAGWQSGVLWADWSPKPSYLALKRVAAEANARTIDCTAFSAEGVPPRPAPVSPAPTELRISGLRVTSVSPFAATVEWRTTLPARHRLAYGLAESGPTLWAGVGGSVLEPEATLPGLAYGTTYRVWVSAVAEDGQRTQATLDLRTPGPPASAAASIGRPAGALLLDGQPFFPLMVWAQCPDGYPASVAAGINLFAENPCGGLQAQLDALTGSAFSAAVAGKEGASGPGLIGFFFPDEPDGLGISGEALPPAPAGAPALGFLTLTNHFYSGAAPLPQGRGIYAGLIEPRRRGLVVPVRTARPREPVDERNSTPGAVTALRKSCEASCGLSHMLSAPGLRGRSAKAPMRTQTTASPNSEPIRPAAPVTSTLSRGEASTMGHSTLRPRGGRFR